MAAVESPAFTFSPEVHISLHEAAALMGISLPLARKIASEGYVARVARGRVSLGAWCRGYAAYRDGGDKRSTRSAASQRVSDARAAEIEQRIAIRDRTVVPAAEAQAAIDHVVGARRGMGLAPCHDYPRYC